MNTSPGATAVCTIGSRNYLHFVRTLMESVRRVHPDWEPYLLLADEIGGVFDPAAEPFHVIEARELPLPDKQKFFFRYTVLELNTAVKPWLLEWLFEQGFERVVYLDPDIRVYSAMSELEEALATANIVLTPHLTGPLDDRHPSELDILRAGSWNLGFIAVRNDEVTRAFLRWWQAKLEFHCIVDLEAGLFVDQKWIDLVPGMFPGVYGLRHEGYNLAYWNIQHRRVTRESGEVFVNSQPLRFFHFSGLNPENPREFSKHQNRFRLDQLDPPVQELVTDYAQAVIENGLAACRRWPYAYGGFANGQPLLDEMRVCYRRSPRMQADAGDDPFQLDPAYFDRRWTRAARLIQWAARFKPLAKKLPRPVQRQIRRGVRIARAVLHELRSGSPTAEAMLPSLSTGRFRQPGSPPGETGVNIVGYLRTETGVGQSARLCAAAAEAARIPHSLVDFSSRCPSRAEDHTVSHRITNEPRYGINLIHVNADQMPVVRGCLGEPVFAGRYNIGYWHWELPEFPDEWRASFDLVDEVWVPTQFVLHSIARPSPVPVVCIPHAIGFEPSGAAARAQFGLPGDRFLFLMMYDLDSFQARKNPQAALDAFVRAFPRQQNVGLVIKSMNSGRHPREFQELRERLTEAPAAVLIDRTLSRQEAYDLQAVCDVYVSLHRSEGFGLGLAESMSLGKPVIGTNWSGNVDFMTARNSCPVDYELVGVDRDYGPYRRGQLWADPDLDHAAWHMQRLVEDPALARRIGQAARATIREHFSYAAVGRRYRERLEVIRGRLASQPAPARADAA